MAHFQGLCLFQGLFSWPCSWPGKFARNDPWLHLETSQWTKNHFIDVNSVDFQHETCKNKSYYKYIIYVNKDSWNYISPLRNMVVHAVMHTKQNRDRQPSGLLFWSVFVFGCPAFKALVPSIFTRGRPNPFRNIFVGEMWSMSSRILQEQTLGLSRVNQYDDILCVIHLYSFQSCSGKKMIFVRRYCITFLHPHP